MSHPGPGGTRVRAVTGRPGPGRLASYGELTMVALLAVLGLLVIVDAVTMPATFVQRGPVGPRAVPLAVGGLLLVVAGALAVDVLRGGRGEIEGADLGIDPGDGDEGRAGHEGRDGHEGRAGHEGRGGGDGHEGRGGGGAAVAPQWRTVLLVSAAFLANVALIDVVGFPISGAILFWVSAYALGSRHPVRDPLVAVALAVLTYLVFQHLLGVPLPGGPLAGWR